MSLHFFACFLSLTKNENGPIASHTVADLQHNQINESYQTASSDFRVTGLTCHYISGISPFLFPNSYQLLLT